MPKVVVTKDKYEQVREAEKALGVKIALAPKEWEMRVPDCINGQCGIYRVKRCYRSGLAYVAEMELIEATDTYEQALISMALQQKAAAEEGKFKLIVTE